MRVINEKSQSPGGNQAIENGKIETSPDSSIHERNQAARDPADVLADIYRLILTNPRGSTEPTPTQGAGSSMTRARVGVHHG